MIKKWIKYAVEKWKVAKGNIAKHCDRNKSGKAPKASASDSVQQSGKKQEQEMKASEKKSLLKHIKKDDKEFLAQIKDVRGQIKDDVKLKKRIMKTK